MVPDRIAVVRVRLVFGETVGFFAGYLITRYLGRTSPVPRAAGSQSS